MTTFRNFYLGIRTQGISNNALEECLRRLGNLAPFEIYWASYFAKMENDCMMRL